MLLANFVIALKTTKSPLASLNRRRPMGLAYAGMCDFEYQSVIMLPLPSCYVQ